MGFGKCCFWGGGILIFNLLEISEIEKRRRLARKRGPFFQKKSAIFSKKQPSFL